MSIPWEKVLTDPLGLAGYALFLVFGVVAVAARGQRRRDRRWIVPVGFALAALCVVGGLGLAFRHESALVQSRVVTGPPGPSMHIDKVEQDVHDGSAVAGVQGNVEINGGSSPGANQNGSGKAKSTRKAPQ